VIVSGVIALTLSPMMCSIFSRARTKDAFQARQRVFGRYDALVWRQLDRSLDYRPITGCSRTILGLVGFLYMHTRKELGGEDQAWCLGHQGHRNTQPRLSRLLRREARQVFASFRRRFRFALTVSTARRTASPGMLLRLG